MSYGLGIMFGEDSFYMLNKGVLCLTS